MLLKLYDMWIELAGVSTVIAILTALVQIYERFNNRNSKKESTVFKILMNFFLICSCFVIVLSFIVGSVFTKVPPIYGQTVHEAMQTLRDSGLQPMLNTAIKYVM